MFSEENMKVRVQDLKEAFPELSHFEVLGVKSGQKIVLKARFQNKPVALKLLRNVSKSHKRIEREIHAVSRLQSDYVPGIYDYGFRSMKGVNLFFILEQFIEGKTFRSIMSEKGKMKLEDVLPLLDTLLRACMDFERAQLVHRDIKPENILIDGEGKYWVIDFGLVRILDMESLTATGLYRGVGTVGYAPPEQFLNLKDVIDSRTDLYSIGIVIYEALHGKNPYLKDWPRMLVILKAMQTQPLPPLDIEGDRDGKFSAFLAKLTAPSPKDRPPFAQAAYKEFRAICDELGFQQA